MAKVDKIRLHPEELISDVCFCIAYCIGADYENDEVIANSLCDDEIAEVIETIRKIHEKYL